MNPMILYGKQTVGNADSMKLPNPMVPGTRSRPVSGFTPLRTRRAGREFRLSLLPRWILLLCVAGYGSAITVRGQDPEIRHPMFDQIADFSEMIVVVEGLSQFKSDVRSLLHDLEFGGLESFLDEIKLVEGIDPDAGGVIYVPADFGNQSALIQFKILDSERLAKNLKPLEGAAEGSLFRIEDNSESSLGFNLGGQVAAIHEGLLICPLDEDRQALARWKSAPPLAASLQSPLQRIVNASGIAVLFSDAAMKEARRLGVADLLPYSREELEPEEQAVFEQLSTLNQKLHRAAIGAKYDKHTLELRAGLQFDSASDLDSLFQLDQREANFQSDLGLVPEQLVFAAAIEMDALKSAALARLTPQVVAGVASQQAELQWLQGNMLQVLAQLCGDSWNDLTAARVALYEAPGGAEESFAIIGVVDAQSVEKVLAEMRRISVLTRPSDAEGLVESRRQEIERLIQQLKSDDYHLRARAAIRLQLAGPDARAALKDVVDSGDARAGRLAGEILANGEADGQVRGRPSSVDAGWFWSTLRPGLTWEENSGRMGEFPYHVLKITPDPGKNEAEVREAIAVMESLFGRSWDTVRAVQVNDHFVFLIGSDLDLLQRVVTGVQQGDSRLMSRFEGIGRGPKRGPIQVFLSGVRVCRLMGLAEVAPSDSLMWAGVDVGRESIELDVLLPASEIVPFVQASMRW